MYRTYEPKSYTSIGLPPPLPPLYAGHGSNLQPSFRVSVFRGSWQERALILTSLLEDLV